MDENKLVSEITSIGSKIKARVKAIKNRTRYASARAANRKVSNVSKYRDLSVSQADAPAEESNEKNRIIEDLSNQLNEALTLITKLASGGSAVGEQVQRAPDALSSEAVSNEKKDLEKELERSKDEKAGLTFKALDQTAKLRGALRDKEKLERDLNLAKAEAEKTRSEIVTIQEKNIALLEQLKDREKELLQALDENNSLKSSNKDLEAKLASDPGWSDYVAELKRLAHDLSEEIESSTKLKNKLIDQDSEICELGSRLIESEKSLKNHQSDWNLEKASLQDEIRSEKGELKSAEVEITRLRLDFANKESHYEISLKELDIKFKDFQVKNEDEKAGLKHKLERSEAEVDALKRDIARQKDRFCDTIASAERDMDKTEEKMSSVCKNAQEEVDKLRNMLRMRETEAAKFKSEVFDKETLARDENEGLRADRQRAEKEMAALRQRLNETEASWHDKLGKSEEECTLLKSAAANYEKQLKAAEQKLAVYDKEMAVEKERRENWELKKEKEISERHQGNIQETFEKEAKFKYQEIDDLKNRLENEADRFKESVEEKEGETKTSGPFPEARRPYPKEQDWTFGFSHHIKNVLEAIEDKVQSCIESRSLKPQERDHLIDIMKNTANASGLIEEFSQASKPIDVDLAKRPLDEILDSVPEALGERCKKQNVEIMKRYPPVICDIMADEFKLEEAFIQIANNAFDAMNEKGCLKIHTQHYAGDKFVEIVFEDNGRGMDQDRVKYAFSPFYSTKSGRFGLGLPNARRVIEAHGGEIDIKSQEDSGTTVTVKLPVA
ncbi:ATP-binding protein [Elusimicrobiota bacterium]